MENENRLKESAPPEPECQLLQKLDYVSPKTNSPLNNFTQSSSPAQMEPVEEEKNVPRMDLIQKTIFRAFRRFYKQDFTSFLSKNYKGVSFIRRNVNQDKIIAAAKQYVENKFGRYNMEQLYLFLIALVDNKFKITKIDNVELRDPKGFSLKVLELRKEIFKLTRAFNTSKSKMIFGFLELSILAHNFLSNNQKVEDMIMAGKPEKEQEAYKCVIEQHIQEWLINWANYFTLTS